MTTLRQRRYWFLFAVLCLLATPLVAAPRHAVFDDYFANQSYDAVQLGEFHAVATPEWMDTAQRAVELAQEQLPGLLKTLQVPAEDVLPIWIPGFSGRWTVRHGSSPLECGHRPASEPPDRALGAGTCGGAHESARNRSSRTGASHLASTHRDGRMVAAPGCTKAWR